MTSQNAQAVANTVISKVRKGEKVVMGEIIKKQGYAPSISTHPTKVTKTQSYKKVIEPYIKRIVSLRDKIQIELDKRDLTEVQFRELNTALKDLTHDIQLLSGGSTENIFQITWER